MKGPKDFINGNRRGSNGHESGQWSGREPMVNAGWPRVAPTFCFSRPMVSCEHPRSCSLVRRFSVPRSTLLCFSLSNSLYCTRHQLSRNVGGGGGGGRGGKFTEISIETRLEWCFKRCPNDIDGQACFCK